MMACVLTLFCSLLGLITAIVALVMFQASFLIALAIWSASGIASLALCLALSLTTPPAESDLAVRELA